MPPLTINGDTGLTNVVYGTSYALCKSLMCRQCGHLFVDYRFSDAEVARLYHDYRGESYARLRESYEPGYSERNEIINNGIAYMPDVELFLNDFVPKSGLTILDWGGDTGLNTPFKNRRSLVHVVDPSGKEVGLEDGVVFSGIPAETVEYDLVILSNVLEHVPFPAETLQAIRPFMAAETVLYVEVPLEMLQLNLQGPPYSGAFHKKHWHEHINFFTAASVNSLLDSCGLDILSSNELEIVSDWHDAAGLQAAPVLQYACKVRF